MALDLLELGARLGRLESRMDALENGGGSDGDDDEDDDAPEVDPEAAQFDAAAKTFGTMLMAGLNKTKTTK